MAHADELPTLRLVTLRRLVRTSRPPLVVSQDAEIGEVEALLRDAPGAVAVVVDGASVLQGTLRLGDLAVSDRHEHAERVMTRTTPVLEGENDIEAARAAMYASGTDRVLVVGIGGELLGVLTDRDLARSRRRTAA